MLTDHSMHLPGPAQKEQQMSVAAIPTLPLSHSARQRHIPMKQEHQTLEPNRIREYKACMHILKGEENRLIFRTGMYNK